MTDSSTPFNCFLGCDVSKDTVTIHDSLSGRTLTITNKRAELEAFFSAFGTGTMAICEATGGYEALLLDVCVKKNFPVHRADTLKVKNFIRSFGTLAKTDNIDAKGLSDYGRERHSCLPLWTPANEYLEALQGLVRRREDLVSMRTAEKNRAQAPKTKGVIARTGRAVLRMLDAQIKRLDEEIKSLLEECAFLHETVDVMTSVTGIGRLSAIKLLALLPELGRLKRKQITALADLAPQARDSGKTCGYRRVRGGRPDIRRMLFLPALSAVRFDPNLKKLYEDKLASGKNKMSAINAIMAKIIVILNARLRDFMANKNNLAQQS
jgi:transposase